MSKNFSNVSKGIDSLFGESKAEEKNNSEDGAKTLRRHGATLKTQNEEYIRLSVRFPPKIHNIVRKKCFKQGVSINSYIIDLIEKDLKK